MMQARLRLGRKDQMAKAFHAIRLTVLTLVAALALVLAAGCGGGGGGGSLAGLNMFITDDLGTGYDQVWVTIHQIEVQDAGGAFRTVFTSTAGVPVNLTSLNDGAPRFLYLGTKGIPAGDYTAVRVTMSRNLTLVATGTATGDACTFDPSLDFGATQSQATFALGGPMALAANDSLIVDFDLPNWGRVGNVVTPAFQLGDDTTLGNPARHEDEDYHGTVASLSGTAPGQTFTLQRASGSFQVVTSTSTIIYEEDASGNPVLANGQEVEVRGTFDTVNNSLTATVIKIEDGNDDDDKVEGPTQNLDDVVMTVDVLANEVEGFLPSDPIVHVQFDTTTRFFTKAGAPLTLAEMLAFLATGVEVEAEGVYDAGTNTLDAAKIKLHPEDENEAEVKGAVSNINAGAGTFDVTLGSWFGFSGSNGQVVHIVTDGSTSFKDDNGDPMTSGDFFAALQNGWFVEVEGAYDNGTITVAKAELEDNTGGGGQPEAKGYIASSDETAGTFTVNLIEWFGFNGSFGAPQVVQTTGTTEYEDENGDPLTKSAFFAGLTVGKVVDAKGSYAGGVLTATRARYKD
jgi:hypothetical protein